MYELCLYGVQADLRVCVFVLLDMCVCVYKPRRSLSPGSNLGLYRGDIRFPIPPHTCVCVSAAVAVIETVGTVCVSVCLVKMGGCVRVMTGDTESCQQKTEPRTGQTA